MGLFRSAEERKKHQAKKRELAIQLDTLPVTTADFKQEYSIISVIQADSLLGLKEKALELQADAVAGIGFYGYDQQCYGTAIRFKEDSKKLFADELSDLASNLHHQSIEKAESSVTHAGTEKLTNDSGDEHIDDAR